MEANCIPYLFGVLLLLFAKEISSHGAMQMPLSWQVGNTQVDLGENSCVSGACNWFTNWTHLPPDQPATIPQDSPLRTFTDVPPSNEDWTARNPWRAPGRAKVYSPCGSEGGNPFGCVQADGTLGPCTIDDGAFAFGTDGRALGGMGVITAWQQGSIVEVGWSIRSNHGGGDSYRLCKKPANGNFSELTEECFAAGALDFVGNTSFIVYHETTTTNGGSRTFEIDAVRTTNGTYPPRSMWTRNPIPCFGHGPDIQGQGTQFPLPTLHGKTIVTPTALAGFCPCRHPRGDAYSQMPFLYADEVGKSKNQTCYCCCGCCMGNDHAPVSFDEWTIVDKIRIPKNLTQGEYVLGFRWDCEVCLFVHACACVCMSVRMK